MVRAKPVVKVSKLNAKPKRFIDLPNIIVVPVFCDWIPLEELRDLDTAFCNIADRSCFLDLIASPMMVHSGKIADPKLNDYVYWLHDKNVSVKQLIFTQANLIKLTDYFALYLTLKTGEKLRSVKIQPSFKVQSSTQNIALNSSLFVHLVQKCPNLTSLTLKSCIITSRLPPNEENMCLKNLSELTINKCSMSPEFFRMLFGKASNVTKMQVSEFRFSVCDDVNRRKRSYAHAEQNISEFYQYFPQLRDIQLWESPHCYYRHAGDKEEKTTTINDIVMDLTIKCPELQVLRLKGNRDLTGETLDAIAANCPQFSALHLKSCGENALKDERNSLNDGINRLLKNCPHLTLLDVHGCHSAVTSTAIDDLLPNLSRITWLSLAETMVSAQDVCRLLQSCDNLEVLDVSRISFGTKAESKNSYPYHQTSKTIPLDVSSIPESLKNVNPRSKLHSFIAQGNNQVGGRGGYGSYSDRSYCYEQITDSALLLFLGIIPCLKRINLNGCKALTEVSLKVVSSCTSLVEVIVSNVSAMTDKHLETLLISSKRLCALDIEGCTFVKKSDALKLLKKFNTCCALVGPSYTVTNAAGRRENLNKEKFSTLK